MHGRNYTPFEKLPPLPAIFPHAPLLLGGGNLFASQNTLLRWLVRLVRFSPWIVDMVLCVVPLHTFSSIVLGRCPACYILRVAVSTLIL